jgi:hypothetical protein
MSSETERDVHKVVALEVSRYSLAGTAEYGEVEYVFSASAKKPPSIWSAKWKHEFLRVLDEMEFDPDLDYFVLVGQVLPMAIAVNILSQKYRVWRALAFNAMSQKYQVILMDGSGNNND